MDMYEELCKSILKVIGGRDNIESASHCATRLRLTLKDLSIVGSDNDIKSIKGVLGLVKINKSYQIIIGPGVESVFLEFVNIAGIQNNTSTNQSDKKEEIKSSTEKKHYITSIVDFISGSFMPVLPIIVAGGLISAILVCCTTFFGVDPNSGTYVVLNSIYVGAFTYLPIYVGYNTAKKLNISPMLGSLLGAVLVSNSISGVDGLDFLGIGITTVNYAQSVLPAMIGVLFMSFVYRPLDAHLPKEIKFVMVPVITMIITVPITLIAIGPIATWIGNLLATATLWLNTNLGGFSVAAISALLPLILFSGTGGCWYPAIFASFAENGFEGFVMTGLLSANLAIAGAACAVSLKLKNKENKSLALSTGITAIFGITEPAIYGVLIRWKKAFIASIIASSIAGLFAGMMNVVEYVFSSPSIISIIAFANPNGSLNNLIMAIITMVIAFAAGLTITLLMNVKEEEDSTING